MYRFPPSRTTAAFMPCSPPNWHRSSTTLCNNGASFYILWPGAWKTKCSQHIERESHSIWDVGRIPKELISSNLRYHGVEQAGYFWLIYRLTGICLPITACLPLCER